MLVIIPVGDVDGRKTETRIHKTTYGLYANESDHFFPAPKIIRATASRREAISFGGENP